MRSLIKPFFSGPRVRSGLLASGTVLLANIRLSRVDGAAFFDISAAGLIPYARGGDLALVLTDSAGKALKGWIGAAGTGETLGDELLTGWTNGGGFGEYTTFEAAGKNITSAINATAGGKYAVTNQLGLTTGWLVKNVLNTTLNSGAVNAFWATNVAGGALDFPSTALSTGVLTKYVVYATGVSRDYLWLQSPGSSGNFSLTPSAKRVLTPSATGVTVVSARRGSTRNWASAEAGFNYNDTSGYTWGIYAGAALP